MSRKKHILGGFLRAFWLPLVLAGFLFLDVCVRSLAEQKGM
jgi:hypothetical protein